MSLDSLNALTVSTFIIISQLRIIQISESLVNPTILVYISEF